jgi:hypothetical protein
MWPLNRGIPLFAQSAQLNEADSSPFHPLRLSTERNLPPEEQCKIARCVEHHLLCIAPSGGGLGQTLLSGYDLSQPLPADAHPCGQLDDADRLAPASTGR